jgi:RNA polymerase sigma-70 factor (ECF subfamily)
LVRRIANATKGPSKREKPAGLRLRNVIRVRSGPSGVSRVIAFEDPALVAMFGLPDVLAD